MRTPFEGLIENMNYIIKKASLHGYRTHNYYDNIFGKGPIMGINPRSFCLSDISHWPRLWAIGIVDIVNFCFLIIQMYINILRIIIKRTQFEIQFWLF